VGGGECVVGVIKYGKGIWNITRANKVLPITSLSIPVHQLADQIKVAKGWLIFRNSTISLIKMKDRQVFEGAGVVP
jgi:hypothetical protein